MCVSLSKRGMAMLSVSSNQGGVASLSEGGVANMPVSSTTGGVARVFGSPDEGGVVCILSFVMKEV